MSRSIILAIIQFHGKCQNLQKTDFHTFLRQLIQFQRYKFLCFTFKKQVKVTEYKFRNDAIRCQMSKSTKDSHTFFALTLTVSEIYFFLICTFKKQVNVTEYNFRNDTIRWQMSKSTKDSYTFLHQLLPIQRYNKFFLPSQSRSRSRSTIFAMTPFDGKCQNLKCLHTFFCASSYRFRYIQILNFLPPKIYKCHFIHFLFSLMYDVCERK